MKRRTFYFLMLDSGVLLQPSSSNHPAILKRLAMHNATRRRMKGELVFSRPVAAIVKVRSKRK